MSGEGASVDGSPAEGEHTGASADWSPSDLYTGASTPSDLYTGASTPSDLYTGASTPSDLYTGASMPSDLYPCLVYDLCRKTRDKKFCEITPSGLIGSEPKCMPELEKKEVIYCSPDGRWLLLISRAFIISRPSIWNLITKESVELPKLPIIVSYGDAVISCSPNDPNCLIFVFLVGKTHLRELLYCRVGDQKWSSFNYAPSIRAQKPRCQERMHQRRCSCIYRPVSFKGKVYGLLSCSDELVEISVDASNNCTTTVLTRNPEPPLLDAHSLYLVQREDGHLYLIMVVSVNCHSLEVRESPDIRVMEFNFSTSSWFTVPSLNGGAVFLSDSYSLALTSTPGQRKWSFIYYTSKYNQMVFSQRMEDGKITQYAPSSYRTMLLRERPEPLWLPRWTAKPKPGPLDDEVSFGGDTSKQVDAIGSNSSWNDVNCFNAMKHVSKKQKFMENVPVEYTPMHCSKKQKVLDNGSAKQKVFENGSARQVNPTSLCDIWPELIDLITEKVSSFVEYTYFLNINKLGSSVARRRQNKFRPCLIYRDRMNTSFYHIIDSKLNREVHVEIPNEVRGKSIGCCRDGWLLIEDISSCCLFNPLTRQVIEIAGCKCRNASYGISSFTFIGGKPSPLSPEKSSVLAMSLFSLRQGSHSRLKPGDAAEAGKAVWWELMVENFKASSNSPVLLGEDWYYLGYCRSAGNLGRLRLSNMEEGKFEWEVEEVNCPCQYYTRNFLTECGGELVSIFIVEDDRGKSCVRVFKIRSDPENKWEEIDSLGGYCLYLGSTSSISCVAETLDMADRIYFPKFYNDGLVYYSLRTKKYHSIGNEQNEVKRDQPITMFSDCAWIIPDFSL